MVAEHHGASGVVGADVADAVVAAAGAVAAVVVAADAKVHAAVWVECSV